MTLVAVGCAAVVSVAGVGAQSTGSGGIGAERADWEDVYGEGEAGQNLMEYETKDGLPIYVGFADGVVSSIEVDVKGAENGGLTAEQAEGLVEALLPADAELDETFMVPASPAHPGRVIYAQSWDSDWLEDNVGEDFETVLVIRQEDQAENSMDTLITGVSLLLEE
jgi:hypothetical protein